MVSGDDDGNVYVLTPDSESTDSWDYTQTTVIYFTVHVYETR